MPAPVQGVEGLHRPAKCGAVRHIGGIQPVKRNIWKLLAVLASVTLFAAACGDSSSTSTENSDAPTTTSAPATTTTAAATTTTEAPLPTLLIWADDTRAPVIQEFGDQFGADNGVNVEVQQVDFGSIRDQLGVAGPAGEGPDIIIGAHDWLGELATNGVVAPIDVSGIADQFLPVAVNAMSYNGVTYGLPYSVENIALIRNTDLVPEPVATFADLEKIALDLKAAGTVDVPLAIQEAPGDPFHNYPMFTAAGGVVFGRNADGSYNPDDLGIDSEGGLAAGRKFSEWAASGLIGGDVNYDVMIESFSTGKAPFAITGPWATGSFADAGVNYSVDPFPTVDGGEAAPFVGVQGFMVSAFAQNPLLAETFVVDYMGTKDAQVKLFEAGGRPPAHLGAIEVASSDADIQGFASAGTNGAAMPAIPEMGAVWSAWTDAYSLIFSGEDSDAALTDAAAQIRDLIAQG